MEKEIKTYLVKVPAKFKGNKGEFIATTKLVGENEEEIKEDLKNATYNITTDLKIGEVVFDFDRAEITDITTLGGVEDVES